MSDHADRLAELRRLTERAERKRDRLIAELATVHNQIQSYTHEIDHMLETESSEPVGDHPGPTSGLSGPAIRLAAYQLYSASEPPIHYQAWYRRLVDAGHTVTGKDPAATFLSSISRSPIVCRAAQPGTYVVDPARINAMLAEFTDAAQTLAAASLSTSTSPEREAELRELTATHRRLLRELDELRSAGFQVP